MKFLFVQKYIKKEKRQSRLGEIIWINDISNFDGYLIKINN